jgi:hypothetical protein
MALPPPPADARSSARDYCVSARTWSENDCQEPEEVHRWKSWRALATRFFRSPLTRPSRTGRENQLYSDESCSQRVVRASAGLGLGLSSERPAVTELVGRAVLCAAIRLKDGAHRVTRPNRSPAVANAPDCLIAVFADKQATVFRDGDPDGATPDFAIGHDEAGHEVFIFAARFAG